MKTVSVAHRTVLVTETFLLPDLESETICHRNCSSRLSALDNLETCWNCISLRFSQSRRIVTFWLLCLRSCLTYLLCVRRNASFLSNNVVTECSDRPRVGRFETNTKDCAHWTRTDEISVGKSSGTVLYIYWGHVARRYWVGFPLTWKVGEGFRNFTKQLWYSLAYGLHTLTAVQWLSLLSSVKWEAAWLLSQVIMITSCLLI